MFVVQQQGGTGRIRIVVADDHPSVRENLRHLLNFEPDLEVVAVARDGVEALQACHELAPDVIVLDHDMPRFTGLEVAQRLRAERSDLHIVLYTAESEVCERAAAAGADACIVKDAPTKLLLDAVRHAARTERAELREAIAGEGLTVAAQPLVSLREGRPARFELLARWNRHGYGEVAPTRFVAMAEASGLITPLTLHVAREAVGWLARWRRSRPTLGASFNLSLLTLLDSDFPGQLAGILERSDLPASALGAEITETTLMRDPAAVTPGLVRLREMGVRIEIDDFGTGFSSLRRLMDLPVDGIKIDRSFVSVMTRDRRSEAVVRACVKLAHDLGLEAIAEGVEDEETWEQLKAIGCDTAQGYYVARPQQPSDIEAWLAVWESQPSHQAALDLPGVLRHSPSGNSDVLVVDDEPVISEMIRDILEHEGFRVMTAANGMEALRAMEHTKPSVVLLDMQMPIVDGPAFAERLRDAGVRVPIVVMTAGPSAARWAEQLSADAFLSKPFELAALLSVTNRFAEPQPKRPYS